MAAMKGTGAAKGNVKKEKKAEGGLKGMKGSPGKVVKVKGMGKGKLGTIGKRKAEEVTSMKAEEESLI